MAKKPLTPSDALPGLLARIVETGKAKGMTSGDIALRAGLAPQTISRMKARKSGDFGAVERMAAVVGLKLTLIGSDSKSERIASGTFFD